MSTWPVDEARASRDADHAHSRRWAIWHRQFDLVRAVDGVVYLTRWWLVKTPWGGIALHRMLGPDARDTLHDHPFPFVSIVLRGGYRENRFDPLTLEVHQRTVRRWNVMPRYGAHSIYELLREPTWTLLFVGRHRRKWGFLEPAHDPRVPRRALRTGDRVAVQVLGRPRPATVLNPCSALGSVRVRLDQAVVPVGTVFRVRVLYREPDEVEPLESPVSLVRWTPHDAFDSGHISNGAGR